MGRWGFHVVETNEIDQRGTVAYGTLSGDVSAVHGSAAVTFDSVVYPVKNVTFEFARRDKGEERVLLLHDVRQEDVPVNSIVRGGSSAPVAPEIGPTAFSAQLQARPDGLRFRFGRQWRLSVLSTDSSW